MILELLVFKNQELVCFDRIYYQQVDTVLTAVYELFCLILVVIIFRIDIAVFSILYRRFRDVK